MIIAPDIAEHPKGKAWHNRSAEEVLAHLGCAVSGLITPEVARQRAALVILNLLGLPSWMLLSRAVVPKLYLRCEPPVGVDGMTPFEMCNTT